MAIVQTPYLVTVPCDSPLLVEDYVARLYQELMHSHAEIGVAQDQTIGLQPVFALIRCELLPGLLAFLECGERQVRKWYARHRMVGVDFSAHPEMFLNVNTPADRALLERWLEGPGFSLTDR
jgi:molybdopterin-guanine dinucleotide biosynthesis protein A